MIRYYSCDDCLFSYHDPGFMRDSENVGQPPTHECTNQELDHETRNKFYGETWQVDDKTGEQTMCPGFRDFSDW